MIKYHPVTLHVLDDRELTELRARTAAARFEKLNGIKPQLVTRKDIGVDVNKHWYCAWIWDVVPDDVEYVLCMDSKILPVRKLPELPELKFAAIMDRHDRVAQGMHSATLRQTGKYFQMQLFVAHRDTRPIFEQLKKLCALPKYNLPGADQNATGFDGRGIFTPMNELIQSNFEVHELSRDWNWGITFEKQFYYEWPYMINFNANDFGTWAYFRYVNHLIEQLELAGGALDGPASS